MAKGIKMSCYCCWGYHQSLLSTNGTKKCPTHQELIEMTVQLPEECHGGPFSVPCFFFFRKRTLGYLGWHKNHFWDLASNFGTQNWGVWSSKMYYIAMWVCSRQLSRFDPHVGPSSHGPAAVTVSSGNRFRHYSTRVWTAYTLTFATSGARFGSNW